MNKDIHLHYTPELTKLAVLYYCWAVTGKLFAWTVMLSILGLVYVMMADGSPMVSSIVMFTLIWVTGLMSLLYYITRKRALVRLDNLDNGKAIFGIADGHFSLTAISPTSDANVPWGSILKIKQYPDFWIILLRPRGYFTLPTYNLLPEDKAFILNKAK